MKVLGLPPYFKLKATQIRSYEKAVASLEMLCTGRTLSNYTAALHSYWRWSSFNKLNQRHVETLKGYLIYLGFRDDSPLAQSTIKTTYASIGKWFRSHDKGSLNEQIQKEWFFGLLRKIGIEREPVSYKIKPLGVKSLKRVSILLENDGTITALRNRAVLLLGWNCALKPKELCGLKWSDIITTKSDAYIEINSRTNNNARTVSIYPATDRRHDPLNALHAWEKHADHNEYVFTGFDTGLMPTKKQLTKCSLTNIVKRNAGNEYSIGSLREGWLNTAIERGVPLFDIHIHTGISTETLKKRFGNIQHQLSAMI